MSSSEWEAVKSEGRVVYYRRGLSDGSYLTVSKADRDSHGYPWKWAHRGPESDSNGYRLHAFELEKSAGTAKTHADRYARVLVY